MEHQCGIIIYQTKQTDWHWIYCNWLFCTDTKIVIVKTDLFLQINTLICWSGCQNVYEKSILQLADTKVLLGCLDQLAGGVM